MKLLAIWPAAAWSTYDVARGLFDAMEAAGHQLVHYQLGRRLQMIHNGLQIMAPAGQTPDPEEVALLGSEAITYRAVASGVRWVVIVNGMGLHPNAVMSLRQVGIKVACWFTEAPYDSVEEREYQLAQLCDLAFVNERTSVASFQDVLDRAGLGGQAFYLRHAINPQVHRPYDPTVDCPLDESERSDVLLVGTGFPERQTLLESIDWTGLRLRLFGLWTGIHPPSELSAALANGSVNCIDNPKTARLYHGATIVLNPHRWHPTAESANPRTFEVAACGAFQIADRRAEIVDLFGDTIPLYEPGIPWQLGALIRRYLADSSARQRSAQAARARILGETFADRARTIIETIAQHQRPAQAASA